jgi:putative phosphoesterase
MKIGFISDVHGNIKSLVDCLDYLVSIDVNDIYFLGDAVGYFPHGKEVLELLEKRNVVCIKGNHDSMLLGDIKYSNSQDKVYGLASTLESLSIDHLNFIKGWEVSKKIQVGNKAVLLTHGSPFNFLEGYIYPNSNFDSFLGLKEDIFVMGHTHRPFIKRIGDKMIVNVGSVGLPRDNGRMMSFGVFDVDKMKFSILRREMRIAELCNLKIHSSVLEVFNRNETFFGTII